MSSPESSPIWVSLLVSLISGAAAGYFAYLASERRLRKEFQLHDSAARVVHALLSNPKWRLRSFKIIRHHLGGFDDKELRQLLVRTGAIRFKSKSGEEVWGLIDRNEDRLSEARVGTDPVKTRPEDSDDDLFDMPTRNRSPGDA